jgi:nucleoside-diphosphate-sugar epimerase
MLVGVIGGAGCLGSVIARTFSQAGVKVRVLDIEPCQQQPDVEFRQIDILDLPALRDALRGVDAVIHLAALHGPAIVGRRKDCWRINVNGTDMAVRAALDVGAKRFVLASSTRMYGAGTPEGPARVQREHSPITADDVYCLTKLQAERIVLETARRADLEGVCLRMGGFWGDPLDCEIRKLSTGLDVYDGATAYLAVLEKPTPVHGMYCVASDPDLSDAVRERMGLDLAEVARAHFPELLEAADTLQIQLPARIGKSTSTDAFRRDFGWAPVRGIRWWSRAVIDGRWKLPDGLTDPDPVAQ